MHFRRLSSLLLGAWLAGIVLCSLFSSQNVRLVDGLARTPSKEAVAIMVKLPTADARLLMGYHATEGNRWLRQYWELAQFGIGAALLISLFLGSKGRGYTIILCLLMLASVAFQHWFLSPEITNLERVAGFASPDAVSLARDRLRTLESGYWLTQMLIVVLGFITAAGLLTRVHRRRHRDVESD